jgi:hypothetical protein
MKLGSLFTVCLSLILAGCTSKSFPLPSSATPTEPSGTVIRNEGQNLILSHPEFYWTLTLPQDWVITYDTGFELEANNAAETAFTHLVSQTWLTKDRKPNARAYVDYWKNSTYGDIFPIFAEGTLVSETEVSQDKFGGPYLRYEFDDSKKGVHYLQVYASGGGPNSLVLTVWAKSTDYPNVQAVLEAILNSVELLQEK